MVDVYVAAGSNIQPGPRLRQALALLRQAFGELAVSPAYRNAAYGFTGEDFVNLAIGFKTLAGVREVMAQLQAIELACGRPREAPKWAPRAMDLDIVLYGDLVCAEPGLTLPRPDLVRRAYMLKPMVDIAPDLEHPTLRRTLRQLWASHEPGAHPLVPVDLNAL